MSVTRRVRMVCVAGRARCVDKDIAVFLGALFHRLVRHIDNHLSEIDALAVILALLSVCRSVVALDASIEHADNKELNIGVEGIYILNDMVPVLKEVFESVFERARENSDKLGHCVGNLSDLNYFVELIVDYAVLLEKIAQSFDILAASALFFENIGDDPCEISAEVVAADTEGDKTRLRNCAAILGNPRFHDLGIMRIVEEIIVSRIIVLKHIANIYRPESGAGHRDIFNSESIGNIRAV